MASTLMLLNLEHTLKTALDLLIEPLRLFSAPGTECTARINRPRLGQFHRFSKKVSFVFKVGS